MYKVVIVEDENLILQGLVYSIPWDQLGCVVVGTGRNGIEGIEAIKEHNPDIVIVDINMPILDGLGMLKETCKEFNYIAIVLSGYSNFEYAKEAIHWGAIRYLLKPLNREELFSAVEEAKKQSDIKKNWLASQQARKDLESIQMNLAPLPGADDDVVVKEMLAFIHAHYQEKIILQDVEKELNYSSTFLNKKFKKTMGTTFIEYLNRYRVQKAVEMLRSGSMRLQDVSWKCGFGDYKYFNVVFRKYVGCGPKEYIASIKQNTEND